MKKLILLLLIPLVSFSQQMNFNDLPDIPVDYISLLTTSKWDNKIIINGGHANIETQPDYSYDYLLVFDISNNSWSTLTTSEPLNANSTRRYKNGEIMYGELYLFNGTTYNNELLRVNLDSGFVGYLQDNPLPREQAGSATDNYCMMYTFGGIIYSDGEETLYTNSLYQYHCDANEWTELAPMPESKSTRGEIINGKLYTIGGYNGSVSNKIDVYNIATNIWENQFTMPFSVSANALTVEGNKIFILGDYIELERIAYFDIQDETFTIIENNMIGRRHFDAEIINQELYIIGGNQTSSSSDGGWLNSIQKADISQLLSTSENEQISNLIAYPNPTSDHININNMSGFKDYVIYDSSSKLLKNGKQIENRKISIKDLAKGTYFISLNFESFSKTFKIIKE
jgi:hypothetical protein